MAERRGQVLRPGRWDAGRAAAANRRDRRVALGHKKGTVSSWRVPSVKVSKAKKKSKDEDDGPTSLLNLGVAHSRTVPLPDVEWMAKFDMKPWKRSKFEAWLGR